MNQSSQALTLFRSMIKLAKRLPDPKRNKTIIQIKNEFRRNAEVNNPLEIESIFKKAEGTIGYLKMITPKGRNQSEPFHKVYGSGNQHSSRKAISNWTGGNLDPDSVSRHYTTLKRAGFRDNAHAKGMF